MKKWTQIVASGAIAAGLALAAAPAGGSTAAAAPKGACKYITTRQAGQILRTPSGSGKSTNRTVSGVKNESCQWNAKKKGTGGIEGKPFGLEIAVQSGADLAGMYQTEKAADPDDTEPVSGLGDDAFLQDNDLHVLVGERVVSVELHNYRYPEPLTLEEIQQKEIDAATIVLGNLPTT